MQSIRVSSVSMYNWVGEKDKSIVRMGEWARRSAAQGAELILFPELSIRGWHINRCIKDYAETIPGPSTEGNDEAMVIADLNPETLRSRRENSNFVLNGLRPEVYRNRR